MTGQFFFIPVGQNGDNCLWIKTDANMARSFGHSNFGTCHFTPEDAVQEISSRAMVELLLSHRKDVTRAR